jgi:hypothetical protein
MATTASPSAAGGGGALSNHHAVSPPLSSTSPSSPVVVASKSKYAASITSDFQVKECQAFIACADKKTKGPKVLCFNNANIPLTTEGFNNKKQLNVNLVVIDCLANCFTRVPYKKVKGTYMIGTDPKSLLQ